MAVNVKELDPKALERLRQRNPGKIPEVAPARRTGPVKTQTPGPTRPGPRTSSPGTGRRGNRARTGSAAVRRTASKIAAPTTRAASSAGDMVITFIGWTLGAIALALLLGMGGKLTTLTGGIGTFVSRFADPTDPILPGNPFAKRHA